MRRVLSFGDRVEIAVGVRAGRSVSEIAVSIGRDKSVVSREIRRNSGRAGYRPVGAHEKPGQTAVSAADTQGRRRTVGSPFRAPIVHQS